MKTPLQKMQVIMLTVKEQGEILILILLTWGTVNTSISNNSGGWLSSSITNSPAGTFNLTTAANTTTSSQSATVTYTTTTQFGHTHTMTFTYTQAGIPIDTDPDQFTFSDVD